MIEQLRSRTYFDSLSDTELNVLADNADLYDLVNLGVLELEYPYVVKPGFSLYHELFFYDIQPGDRIAEIGAGSGEFSIVLAAIYDSLVLYINELDHYEVNYIAQKVEKLKSLLDPSEVLVVQGGITQSGLEEGSVDKIVLRNTYHHFTEKKFMLASLHTALTDGGLLFLYEATRDLNKKDRCTTAMKEKDIVKLISKSGFNYLDRKVVDNVVLLKFEVTRG
jgi:SAM-dependent methyltransferase